MGSHNSAIETARAARRHMIAGGAAAEAEVSQKLAQYAKTISGIESECINAYAEVSAESIRRLSLSNLLSRGPLLRRLWK